MTHGLAWLFTLTWRSQARPWAVTNQILKKLTEKQILFYGTESKSNFTQTKKNKPEF